MEQKKRGAKTEVLLVHDGRRYVKRLNGFQLVVFISVTQIDYFKLIRMQIVLRTKGGGGIRLNILAL